MNDTKPSDHEEEMPHSVADELASANFQEFWDALKMLYIRRNQSGRISFTKKWQNVALYLFSEDLIQCDTDGTDDRDARAALEERAELRQIELLDICEHLEERSMSYGSLQVEYVEEIVRKFGRDVALYIYSEKVVNRFLPPPTSETETPAETEEEQKIEPVADAEIKPEIEVAVETETEAVLEEVAPETPPENKHSFVAPRSVSGQLEPVPKLKPKSDAPVVEPVQTDDEQS